jgi:hypothetical protein
MIHKKKLRTLSIALAIFGICVVFVAFNGNSVYEFIPLFRASAVPVRGTIWVVLVKGSVVIAVCDLCATLIYVYHSVIKHRPL